MPLPPAPQHLDGLRLGMVQFKEEWSKAKSAHAIVDILNKAGLADLSASQKQSALESTYAEDTKARSRRVESHSSLNWTCPICQFKCVSKTSLLGHLAKVGMDNDGEDIVAKYLHAAIRVSEGISGGSTREYLVNLLMTSRVAFYKALTRGNNTSGTTPDTPQDTTTEGDEEISQKTPNPKVTEPQTKQVQNLNNTNGRITLSEKRSPTRTNRGKEITNDKASPQRKNKELKSPQPKTPSTEDISSETPSESGEIDKNKTLTISQRTSQDNVKIKNTNVATACQNVTTTHQNNNTNIVTNEQIKAHNNINNNINTEPINTHEMINKESISHNAQQHKSDNNIGRKEGNTDTNVKSSQEQRINTNKILTLQKSTHVNITTDKVINNESNTYNSTTNNNINENINVNKVPINYYNKNNNEGKAPSTDEEKEDTPSMEPLKATRLPSPIGRQGGGLEAQTNNQTRNGNRNNHQTNITVTSGTFREAQGLTRDIYRHPNTATNETLNSYYNNYNNNNYNDNYYYYYRNNNRNTAFRGNPTMYYYGAPMGQMQEIYPCPPGARRDELRERRPEKQWWQNTRNHTQPQARERPLYDSYSPESQLQPEYNHSGEATSCAEIQRDDTLFDVRLGETELDKNERNINALNFEAKTNFCEVKNISKNRQGSVGFFDKVPSQIGSMGREIHNNLTGSDLKQNRKGLNESDEHSKLPSGVDRIPERVNSYSTYTMPSNTTKRFPNSFHGVERYSNRHSFPIFRENSMNFQYMGNAVEMRPNGPMNVFGLQSSWVPSGGNFKPVCPSMMDGAGSVSDFQGNRRKINAAPENQNSGIRARMSGYEYMNYREKNTPSTNMQTNFSENLTLTKQVRNRIYSEGVRTQSSSIRATHDGNDIYQVREGTEMHNSLYPRPVIDNGKNSYGDSMGQNTNRIDNSASKRRKRRARGKGHNSSVSLTSTQGEYVPPSSSVKPKQQHSDNSPKQEDSQSSWKCCCGRVFTSKRQLSMHAGSTAYREANAGEYDKCLSHINQRLLFNFSNSQTKRNILILKDKVLNLKKEQESSSIEGERSKTDPKAPPIDVYTDGSGSSDDSGSFLCGFGVNIVDGEQYAFSLPGSVQTVIRAELMGILTAILATDKNRLLKIYTDSEVAQKWYSESRRTFVNLMDNEGKDNGDILGLIVRAAQNRNIELIKVKAHTEKDDVFSKNNEIADKLANEGRLKERCDHISIDEWIAAQGWSVPTLVNVSQPKIKDEKLITTVGYKDMKCELCGEVLENKSKKREHVRNNHKDYFDKLHSLYSCNVPALVNNEKEDENKENLTAFEIVEEDTDTTELEITSESITIMKRIPILISSLKEEGEVSKLSKRIIDESGGKTWDEHVKLLSELKRNLYNEVNKLNKLKRDERASKRKMKNNTNTKKDNNNEENVNNNNNIPSNTSQNNNIEMERINKLHIIKESLTKARNKMKDGNLSQQEKNALRKDIAKLVSKENKLKRKTEDKKLQENLRTLYNLNPRKVLRKINKEENIECPLTKEDMENYFKDIFKKKVLNEEARPDWWNEESIFKKFSQDSIFMLSNKITKAEVESAFASMSNQTAPGIDGIQYEMWKLIPKYSEVISCILNTWVKYKRIPRENCLAKIILIYKKGDPKSPKSWRPISLQQSITKVFMKIIQMRLLKCIMKDGILSKMQKGFIALNGCLEHVQTLTMACNDARRNLTNIYGVFYDLENAFGNIPQSLMFEILEKHNVPPIIIEMIKYYYNYDRTIIVNGNIKTDILVQETGVKQGCPLSPLLFILSLDPLLRRIEEHYDGYKTKLKIGVTKQIHYRGSAFADDLVLVSGNKESLEGIHDELQRYLEFTKMKIGISKSRSFGITFKKQKKTHDPILIKVGEENIPTMKIEEVYDYLGVTVAPNTGKQVKRKKCSERVDEIINKIEAISKAHLLPWQLQDAIRTYYLPALVYSMQQLNHNITELQRVDKAVRKAIKESLELPQSVPSDFIHGSNNGGGLGIPEVTVERDIFMIATWYKMLINEDEIIKSFAWKELEEYAYSSQVIQYEDAEFKTNSLHCPHFLNWATELNGKVKRRTLKGGNERITSLLRALASLGCQIKKTQEGVVQLYVGSVPVDNNNVTQTLRGVFKEKRLASWKRTTTGTHLNLAIKAQEGNWWISHPEYISTNDYKFACKVRTNCLPCPANLQKWKVTQDKRCPLCGYPNCTQKHILAGCPKLAHHYTNRHNYMMHTVEQIITNTLKSVVFKEKTIPNTSLRPDLTIPEGKDRGIFLDIGVTGGEDPDKTMARVNKEKYTKYTKQRGIKIVDGKEQIAEQTFRFIPLLFTTTGLYKPSLYTDLRNILKLPKETLIYLLRKLSAQAIKGSRITWLAFTHWKSHMAHN